MSDIVKETLEGHLKDVSIAYSQIFKSLVLFFKVVASIRFITNELFSTVAFVIWFDGNWNHPCLMERQGTGTEHSGRESAIFGES